MKQYTNNDRINNDLTRLAYNNNDNFNNPGGYRDLNNTLDSRHLLPQVNSEPFNNTSKPINPFKDIFPNQKQFKNASFNQINNAKQYFNTTEILNRQTLPLQQEYKKKVQDYFKKKNDQF